MYVFGLYWLLGFSIHVFGQEWSILVYTVTEHFLQFIFISINGAVSVIFKLEIRSIQG